MSPLISIIIPIYNAEKYLPKCLNSLISQTYKNLEIICIDDGSTDSSHTILTRYTQADKRVIAYCKCNGGISSARNFGLEQCSGDYVVFVDGDDWLDNDTCEKALNAAIRHDADIVLWPYIKEYETKSLEVQLFSDDTKIWEKAEITSLQKRMIGLSDKELSDPSKLDSLVTVWGKLYRRCVLEKQEFVDTKLIGTAEDALFNISLLFNANSAVYIANTRYHYFKGNGNSFTSARYKPNLVFQWQELFRKINEVLLNNQAPSNYYDALSNRIALGIPQLGLSLYSDKTLSYKDKIAELKKILTMKHYREALHRLPMKYMPIHWKVFFFCAKHRLYHLLLCLLSAMDKLRRLI